MYYYAWIMFSVVIAAAFAAISLRYIGRRQENFGNVLNIFSNNKKDGSSIALIRKYTKDIDVFHKIAKRCVFYSLSKYWTPYVQAQKCLTDFCIVPLVSKSWGVGIEISAAVHAPVPYAIFLIDRLFACLLGN